MKPKRILWVTPKWPYPPDDGAKVASRALLRSLPDRERIDLLALVGEGESCDREALAADYGLDGAVMTAVRQDVASGTKRHGRNLMQMIRHPATPVTLCRYGISSLKQCFRSILNEDRHSVIVFDGLHGAAISSDGNQFVPPAGVKVVYRAHNVEWQLWEKAAANASFIFRPILRRQATLMKRFESSVVMGADLVVPVSIDDKAVFDASVPDARTTVVPIGLDFPSELPPFPTDDNLHLVFLGRLDWPPNRDGLHWFLTKVWPRLRRTDLRLSVAGVGDGEWVKNLLPLKGVDFLGRIASPDALYADAHAAVVPIFYGGGTRLKMIEPARFGRPCISTKAGALGSTLEPSHYLHAETVEEWVTLIESLTTDDCRRVGTESRERLKQAFDEKKVAAAFSDALSALSD